MSTVKIRGVTKSYGNTRALGGIDLELSEGGITALLGPSGCGKTTLLRILAGLEEPDAGRVEIDGEVVNDPRLRVAPERRGIGMVFQDSLLWPHLRVSRNIAFPIRAGADDPRVRAAAERAEVSAFLDRYPAGLSGGEQRRVAIARATVSHPRLLLLDEPLSGLDAHLRLRLLASIRSIQRALSVTTCYVTHDQAEALGVADRVAVLSGGRVVQTGRPEEIYRRPRTAFVARFVGLSALVRAEVAGGVARTSLGEFPVENAPEGPVRLAVRPEWVRVVDDGPLAARVTDRSFRGDRWLLTLEVGEVRLYSFAEEAPGVGESVFLRLDPAPVPVEEDEETA